MCCSDCFSFFAFLKLILQQNDTDEMTLSQTDISVYRFSNWYCNLHIVSQTHILIYCFSEWIWNWNKSGGSSSGWFSRPLHFAKNLQTTSDQRRNKSWLFFASHWGRNWGDASLYYSSLLYIVSTNNKVKFKLGQVMNMCGRLG